MATLQQLIDQARITPSELSRRANVDYKTLRKAISGETVMRVKVLDLLSVLNERLSTNYRPEDMDGVNFR